MLISNSVIIVCLLFTCLLRLAVASTVTFSIETLGEKQEPLPIAHVPFVLDSLDTEAPQWDISKAVGCRFLNNAGGVQETARRAQVLCTRTGLMYFTLTGGPAGARETREISVVIATSTAPYRWSAALVGPNAYQADSSRLAAVVDSENELRIWVRNFQSISADDAAPHTWGWHAPGFTAAPGTDPAPTADEARLTRVMHNGRVLPTVSVADIASLVPVGSVRWVEAGGYFALPVIIASTGTARFSVSSGAGGDAGKIADAVYMVIGLGDTPGAIDPLLYPEAQAALLPLFIRPTPVAIAAAVTPGLRGLRRDTALPAHVFIAGPTTDPDVPGGPLKPRTHFLASYGAPEDAVPAHFSRRFFDGTSPLDDPTNPFEFTQMAVLGAVTLVVDISKNLWAHVDHAELEDSAKALNMTSYFDFDHTDDGDEEKFVLIHKDVNYLVGGAEGSARGRLQGTPADKQVLIGERVTENQQLSFGVHTSAAGVRSYTVFGYHHVIAAALWAGSDPARHGQAPLWGEMGAMTPPEHMFIDKTTTDDNIIISWHPSLAPSYLTCNVVERQIHDPAKRYCSVLRQAIAPPPLNTTGYTDADLAVIDHSQVFVTVPTEICSNGIEIISFGRGFPEALLVHPDGRLFRMALAGSVQAEPLRLLGGGDPVLQLPGGDTFDAVTQLEPGVVGLTTTAGRVFITLCTNTETTEMPSVGRTLWLGASDGWGMIGVGLIPPPGPGLTGGVKRFNLDLFSKIKQLTSNDELDVCPLATLAFEGSTENRVDRDDQIDTSIITESRMRKDMNKLQPSLAEIASQPTTNVAYSLMQPLAAGSEILPDGGIRHGYMQIALNRTVPNESSGLTIAAGGVGRTSPGSWDFLAASLRMMIDIPAHTASLTLSTPMATVACLVDADVLSGIVGSVALEPVHITSADWSLFPNGAHPVVQTLEGVTISDRFAGSPFSLAKSYIVAGACPLGKRVSMAGISFDPADCPDFSAPDGARRFTTYDPRQHGPRARVEPGLWRTFANGTVSTTQFEYPFERFGCPISVYHSAFLGFAPKLNLIANGESNPLGSADFVVSELAGRSDFGYRMRGSDPGVCAHAPMTWAEARRRAEDRFGTGSIDMPKPWNVWQPSVHLGCNDKEVAGRPAPSGAPLELFGRTEYNDEFGRPNALAFPPNGVGGMFFMRARVVESGLSHCDLFTDFALDVYGAPVSLSTAMAALFGTIGVCVVILGSIFGIYASRIRWNHKLVVEAAIAQLDEHHYT